MSTRPGDRVLSLLRGLSDITEPGRPVDQLTHSLQVAAHAEHDGADDELVVAALCHDIGHVLPVSDHALIAACALEGYVRPEVVAIVASHTALGDDPHAPAYAGRPWLEEALRFAEWNRRSFDPHVEPPPLTDHAARVTAVFSERRSRRSVGLADLVGDMPVEDFVRDCFGQRPLVDRAVSANRFDQLLDLATTEQLALHHHRDRAELDPAGRPYDRLQIGRTEGFVPRGALHRSLLAPAGELEVLDLGAVSAHLAGGAPVTVRAVEELVADLSETTRSVADGLGRTASMQAVATWRPGGASHSCAGRHLWILQLAGSRAWTVRGSEEDSTEHVLAPGDAFYVPAGWHAAWQDVEVPALHLVIEISDAAPRDLFGLLEAALVGADDVRADLPLPQGEERDAHAERLRRALVAALEAPT